jgi:hypothetical protein
MYIYLKPLSREKTRRQTVFLGLRFNYPLRDVAQRIYPTGTNLQTRTRILRHGLLLTSNTELNLEDDIALTY